MKRLFVWTVFFVLIAAGGAFATPITVTSVNSSNTANILIPSYSSGAINANTEYTLSTNLGVLDAFCVEGVPSGTGAFEILPVTTNLQAAAWVAEQYWTKPSSNWIYNKEDTQIIIWEMVLGTNFQYNYGAGFADNAAVLAAIGALPIGTPSSNVSLVHNPIGSSDPGYQDFLVKHSVPEPSTMLLLGLSMFGLGIAQRKISRNS